MAEFRKYGESTVILFPLIDFGATDYEATPVTFAAGDTQISKDEGAFANTTNNPVHEGNGIYSVTLTATEMQVARGFVTIKDQDATKTWEDQSFAIDAYGNASAQHAFDLDTATQSVNVETIKSFDAGVYLETQAGNALTSYDAVSNFDLTTALGGLNDPSLAEINTEIDTALADIHLDHLLAVDYDPASKPGVATALLNELVESDAGVSRFTVNALENAPSGSGASAATIAAAVWDSLLANHVTADTFGEHLGSLSSGGGATASEIADAVWDEDPAGHIGASTFGGEVQTHARLSEVQSEIATVNSAIAALNDLSQAQAQSAAEAALAVYDGPTKAELDAGFAALNDPTSSEIATAVLNSAIAESDIDLTWPTTVKGAIAWRFAKDRNKQTQDGATTIIRNAADNANLGSSTTSESAGVVTIGAFS